MAGDTSAAPGNLFQGVLFYILISVPDPADAETHQPVALTRASVDTEKVKSRLHRPPLNFF